MLEEASRSVLLGRDTFAVGRIGATTTDAAVRALSGFRRMMDDYGVTRTRAVATSAVREAANCDTFLDCVRVRTGVDIEVIDGSEESRLTYLAVRDSLSATPRAGRSRHAIDRSRRRQRRPDTTRKRPAGSGRRPPLGAIRLRQRLGVWFGSHEQRIRLLTAQVVTTVSEMVTEVPVSDASFVVALGSEMRFAAARLVETEGGVAEIGRDAFMEFAQEVAKRDEDGAVSRYRLSPIEAETMVPALLVYRALIEATAAQTIVVPEVSLRAGLLIDPIGGSAAEADFAPRSWRAR